METTLDEEIDLHESFRCTLLQTLHNIALYEVQHIRPSPDGAGINSRKTSFSDSVIWRSCQASFYSIKLRSGFTKFLLSSKLPLKYMFAKHYRKTQAPDINFIAHKDAVLGCSIHSLPHF